MGREMLTPTVSHFAGIAKSQATLHTNAQRSPLMGSDPAKAVAEAKEVKERKVAAATQAVLLAANRARDSVAARS